MSNDISNLCLVTEYQKQREYLFKSVTAMNWFVRLHKKRLVKDGALLLLLGQWRVNPERCDQVVADIGREQAAARVAEAA